MGEIYKEFSDGMHLNDFFNTFKMVKKRREAETGVVIFSGRQGSGKTTSMIEYLNKLHKVYGDNLKVYSNMVLYKYNDGSKIKYTPIVPEDIYSIKFDNNFQNVCIIDEISTLFIALTGQKLDASVYQAFCQLRKRDTLIISTAQVYTRIVTAVREQCTYCVECHRLWLFQYNIVHDLENCSDIETLDNPIHRYFFIPFKCYQGFQTKQIIYRKGTKR